MKEFGLGKLTFTSQAVLGIFPQSDSALLQDYEELEKAPNHSKLSAYFEGAISNELPKERSKAYIREEERYFVTPLDESQEEVLLSVKIWRISCSSRPSWHGKISGDCQPDRRCHGTWKASSFGFSKKSRTRCGLPKTLFLRPTFFRSLYPRLSPG